MTCQSVSRPAMIMSNQPREEATFVRCPTFPYGLPSIEGNGALEEGVIADFAEYLPEVDRRQTCLSSSPG
jgi:hypothetical protein